MRKVCSIVKFGVSWNTAYYGTDPEAMAQVANHAEELGFESFYMPEHIVLDASAGGGAVRLPPGMEVVDPLVCLGYVAAATETIVLGTGVLLLPYHHPVLLAKQLATLDLLSHGRLRLVTIGLGTVEAEARAFGVDFKARGRVVDEAMDVLRLLWAGDENGVSHHGESFTFDSLTSFPKPHQHGGIPLHVGGASAAAARRAGAKGDGWFPGGRLSLVQRADQWSLVQATAKAAGQDLSALDYTRWGAIDMSPDDVRARAEQGVTRLVVASSELTVDGQKRELDAFAERHALSKA